MFFDFLFSSLQRKSSEERRSIFASDTPTITIPNQEIKGWLVEKLMGHKDISHKSGTLARNIINYFHYPADCHQENLDDGPLYSVLSQVTARILAVDPKRLAALVDECLDHELLRLFPRHRSFAVVRLRDLLIPVTTRIFYALIFGTKCPDELVGLLADNCLQVIRTIKGLGMPDFGMRDRTLDRLAAEVARSDRCSQWFPDGEISVAIRAKHLQGVFFNSGSIQLAECVSHVLIETTKSAYKRRQRRDAAAESLPESALDAVLDETLRLYPLFGVTNRIAVQDIKLHGLVLRKGTQILIDFMRHHRSGYASAESWQPERWQHVKKSECSYMPFGAGPRRCPAERFSRLLTKHLITGLLKACEVDSPTRHFRSLDGGGLAVLWRHRRGAAFSRPEAGEPSLYRRPLHFCLRSYVQLRDAFEQFQFYAKKRRTFPRIAEEARQGVHIRHQAGTSKCPAKR